MTRKQAERWLARAEKHGYVAYHSGIVRMEGRCYGINIDGDGRNGRFFGCPKIFWTQESLVDFFADQGIEFTPYV